MPGHDIESWEKVTAEIEIRRWLVQHNLWAPDAARAFSRMVGEQNPEPGTALSAMLPLWPELRRQLEQQIVERTLDDPHFHAREAVATIKSFDVALRQLAELTVFLRADAKAVNAAPDASS